MTYRLLTTVCAAAGFAMSSVPAHAALSLTLERDASGLFDSYEHVQDFDSLARANGNSNLTWANDATLAGWSLFDSTKAAKTFYRASSGADAGGYFYSYGLNNDGDRSTSFWPGIIALRAGASSGVLRAHTPDSAYEADAAQRVAREDGGGLL